MEASFSQSYMQFFSRLCLTTTFQLQGVQNRMVSAGQELTKLGMVHKSTDKESLSLNYFCEGLRIRK